MATVSSEVRRPLAIMAGAVLLALPGAVLGACDGLAPDAAPSPSPSLTAPAATEATREALPDGVLDVRSFGARGDGTADDSAALQRAVDQAAQTGAAAFVPAGTYRCPTPIELPAGVTLRGESTRSWLKGQLLFDSDDTVEGLKIGDVGSCAVTTHADTATGTVFRDCRFRGGGEDPGEDGCVVFLGGYANVRDILFEDCVIERSSYAPPADVDAYARGVGNTISINEFGHLPDSGHVEGITFRDCHLGASNGTATGALRMMMEAFTWSDQQPILHGWRDLTFDSCTIEASDTTGLDFADGLLAGTERHAARGVLVTGCTFLGARRDETWGHGGTAIVYEAPTDIVIRDNLFYATPENVIGGSHIGKSTDSPGLLIQGNTFDMTKSPGGSTHRREQACINLVGYNSRVLDNTFIYDAGWGVFVQAGSGNTVFATAGNVIRGNTFTDTRVTGGEPTIVLTDDYGLGCYDNRITANTIVNRAAGSAGVIVQSSGAGTNYATDNVIDCGSAVPFVVVSGEIVQRGNRIIGSR